MADERKPNTTVIPAWGKPVPRPNGSNNPVPLPMSGDSGNLKSDNELDSGQNHAGMTASLAHQPATPDGHASFAHPTNPTVGAPLSERLQRSQRQRWIPVSAGMTATSNFTWSNHRKSLAINVETKH